MDIEKYQELTGITVSASNQAAVKAQIKRAKTTLETLLGYTLTKNKVNENEYEEKGKTKVDCAFLTLSQIDIDSDLNPADEVVSGYRLFRYNELDKYLTADPFTKLNAVKLVFIESGDEPNGITIKTFNSNHLRVQKLQGFSKYIEICRECWCLCECKTCVQVAIDADWLYEDCLPNELLYLWADIVTYEVDCKKNIKSESVGPHSYTKFDKTLPQDLPKNLAVIQKYAGPNGTAFRTITV